MKTINIWNSKRLSWEEILVDDEDFERINKFNWSMDSKNYIHRKSLKDRTKTIWLSRFILRLENQKIEVDHKDRNPLNNQKENLRVCDRSQNSINKPPAQGKYKGITYYKNNGKWVWRARIKYCGREKFIGHFGTAEEAALAYDKTAKQYFGEFAYLNFPNG